MQRKANELVSELLRLDQEVNQPFPYADCRKLLHQAGAGYDDFISDLNMYFYDISSHCAAIRKVLKWEREKLLESFMRLQVPFFDRYPHYKSMEYLISELDTPRLHTDMVLHERMRTGLLDLFSQLLFHNTEASTLI